MATFDIRLAGGLRGRRVDFEYTCKSITHKFRQYPRNLEIDGSIY
jgi:hypothetical protein